MLGNESRIFKKYNHAGDANVTVLQCGVGDGTASEAEFTLYPEAAGTSAMTQSMLSKSSLCSGCIT